MTDGYVLGVDFGLKHIGIAVGQTVTQTANGIATLAAKNGKPDWQELEKIINQYRPLAVVVGLPLNMDGTPSDMSDLATGFAQTLAGRISTKVYLADERLSSWAVRGSQEGEGENIHNASASLIAQTFLNDPSRCNAISDD